MRITLVISSLSSGGAERVMSIMANYWAARDKKVTLITFAAESTDFYVLRPEVRRVALGLTAISRHPWEALQNNLRRLKRLRQEIRTSEPDVVISFMDSTNVSTLLAGLGLNTPVTVSIRTDPRQHHIGWVWSALRRLLYPRAHAVVVQSEEVRRWARRFIRKEIIHTISNPAALPAYRPNSAPGYSLGPDRTVIAMGRLGPEKGYDLLVRAFAKCAAKYPDWSLVILGEGEERGRLEALVGELGIADRVNMLGQIAGPTELLRQADLFVLSSRFEGFPNALLEAMACGITVVSTDCPSGPREIIRDGVDGVLVAPEDVGALAVAMGRLMSDEAERKRLASRAVEVTERFSLEKVMGLWEDVLGRVVEEKHMTEYGKEVAQGERFKLGENWSRFLEVLGDERISEAERSLKQMLEVEDLAGKSFLDIGSGSGLFSLVARRLGARVHSFDYDPRSLACTRELKRRYFPGDADWMIEEGSVLDRDYLESLGKFDIVYSWGMLHHTGAMWQALENAGLPVGDGGRLFIAIYNDQGGKSRRWRKVKQLYLSGSLRKNLVSALFIPYFVLKGLGRDLLLERRNPVARYTEYKRARGMPIIHDWFDWLGGYLFEGAKPEEIFEFYRDRGFVLEKLVTVGGGLANNQFVFTRR